MQNLFYAIGMVLLWHSSVAADISKTLELDLPTPAFAKNIKVEKAPKLLETRVSFDLADFEPAKVLSFYSDFFTSIGWTPTVDDSISNTRDRWASYSVRFDESNHLNLSLGHTWKSDKLPALASVSLTLTHYSNNKFSGTALVVVAPNVNPESQFKLSELIWEQPKNLFLLYQRLGHNPFEIEKVKVPSSSVLKEEDGLLQKYYSIVSEILEDYENYSKANLKKTN